MKDKEHQEAKRFIKHYQVSPLLGLLNLQIKYPIAQK